MLNSLGLAKEGPPGDVTEQSPLPPMASSIPRSVWVTRASMSSGRGSISASSSRSLLAPLPTAAPVFPPRDLSRTDRSRSMATPSGRSHVSSDGGIAAGVRSESWSSLPIPKAHDGPRPSDADVFSDVEEKELPPTRDDALAALVDTERKKLEALVQAPVSRVFVFVAGDLNYRLDLKPDQAIRAVARAANDPVRPLRVSPVCLGLYVCALRLP